MGRSWLVEAHLAGAGVDGEAPDGEAEMVIPSFARVWFLAGPLLAMALATAGSLLVRRRVGWARMVGPIAAAAGWAALAVQGGAGWRQLVWPRGGVETLVIPALVLALACRLGWGRWVGLAAVWFGAWWLAGHGGVGGAYWRVLFSGLGVAWALVWFGARIPVRSAASGLTLAGAGLLVGAPGWAGAGLVLAGASVGVRAGTMPAGLAMLSIVGGEIGAGRLWRGGVGAMDLACLGAVMAPALVPVVERRLGRMGRGIAGWAAAIVVAFVLVAVAFGAVALTGLRVSSHTGT